MASESTSAPSGAALVAVPKPDKDAHATAVKTLNDTIEALIKKRDKLQERIESSRRSSDELNVRIREARFVLSFVLLSLPATCFACTHWVSMHDSMVHIIHV
jgi:outer membrane murein-binding lipoprotein Lpp